MNKPAGRLIVLDGVNGAALNASARNLATDRRDERSCVSVWDASGIFGEIQLANVGAGTPSARTLLLLYAADLAYRLRAEIMPALEAGRLVVAAPYVGTAIAFADALGLNPQWVAGMLSFAPAAERGELVTDAPEEEIVDRKGFVEFCCRQLLKDDDHTGRLDLIKRTDSSLSKLRQR